MLAGTFFSSFCLFFEVDTQSTCHQHHIPCLSLFTTPPFRSPLLVDRSFHHNPIFNLITVSCLGFHCMSPTIGSSVLLARQSRTNEQTTGQIAIPFSPSCTTISVITTKHTCRASSVEEEVESFIVYSIQVKAHTSAPTSFPPSIHCKERGKVYKTDIEFDDDDDDLFCFWSQYGFEWKTCYSCRRSRGAEDMKWKFRSGLGSNRKTI